MKTPEAVRGELGRPAAWRVVEDRNLSPCRNEAPILRTTWVELAGFRFLDHEGTLRLHFWNGRLADTRLYPVRQADVVAELEPKLGIHLRRHTAGHLLAMPAEQVMVVADTDGWGEYISWTDVRLLSESDDWRRIYGEAPECVDHR